MSRSFNDVIDSLRKRTNDRVNSLMLSAKQMDEQAIRKRREAEKCERSANRSSQFLAQCKPFLDPSNRENNADVFKCFDSKAVEKLEGEIASLEDQIKKYSSRS